MVRQQLIVALQLSHRVDKPQQLRRLVDIGNLVTDLLCDLRQNRAAHSIATGTEIHQYQQRVAVGM